MGQRLGQFAMSVVDLRRTYQWYQDVLGFEPAGGTEAFEGPAAETVMGIPGAQTTCWWLVDQQEQFQLEFFQFKRPQVRLKPRSWRRCDIGYTTLGIHVPDFDAMLDRARRAGTPTLTEPMGNIGERRVCLYDPEGMLLELMEEDIRARRPRSRPRATLKPVTRFVTLSVPNLEKSRAFFVDVMQLEPATDVELHRPEHEALWGLAGARRDTLLLWADDMLVEIVQYRDPIGLPWPHRYRISDQGPLNMAFVYRQKFDLNYWFKSSVAAGARSNFPTIYDFEDWGVMYINDPQEFSLELLYVREHFDSQLGFLPASPDRAVECSVDIGASSEAVWQRLVDHENIGDWWCYHGRLIREGDCERNGPGAIRELQHMEEWLSERIVAWDPPRRLDYRLTAGAPVNYHFARIDLETLSAGRTRVRYAIRFCPQAEEAGQAIEDLIRRRLTAALSGLAQLCERSGFAG